MASAARTAAACRIARLDRQKFNDLMASGAYPCAPATTPGVPRIFEEPDLIGLFIFTRLTERGWLVRQASDVACQIVGQINNAVNNGKEIPSHVAIAYGIQPVSFCAAVEAYEHSPNGKNIDPFASHVGGIGTTGEVMWTETWNIANVLHHVRAGLVEENRVVGED